MNEQEAIKKLECQLIHLKETFWNGNWRYEKMFEKEIRDIRLFCKICDKEKIEEYMKQELQNPEYELK